MLLQWTREYSPTTGSAVLSLTLYPSRCFQSALRVLVPPFPGSNYIYGAGIIFIMLLIWNPDIPIELIFWFYRRYYSLRLYLRRATRRFMRYFRRVRNFRLPYVMQQNLRANAVPACVGICYLYNMYRLFYLRQESAAMHINILYITCIVSEMIIFGPEHNLNNGYILQVPNLISITGLILLVSFPNVWNRTFFIPVAASYFSVICHCWHWRRPIFLDHGRARNGERDIRMPARLIWPGNLRMLFRIMRENENFMEVNIVEVPQVYRDVEIE